MEAEDICSIYKRPVCNLHLKFSMLNKIWLTKELITFQVQVFFLRSLENEIHLSTVRDFSQTQDIPSVRKRRNLRVHKPQPKS